MIAKKLGKVNLLELKEISTEEALKTIGDNSRIINELGFYNYTDIEQIIEQIILGIKNEKN